MILGAPGGPDLRVEGAVEWPSSFGEDSCGRIYVASYTGVVHRLAEGTSTDCKPPQLFLWGKGGQRLRRGARISVNAYATEAAAVTLRVARRGKTARRAGLDSIRIAGSKPSRSFTTARSVTRTQPVEAEPSAPARFSG